MNELYKRVRCSDCNWADFQSGEAVGMTPCNSCNSTGYRYIPYNPGGDAECQEAITEQRRYFEGKVTEAKEFVRAECKSRIREIKDWIESTFSKEITLNQMMATNAYQSFWDKVLGG